MKTMKNIYFILAAAASVAFASCTSDELVGGENQGTEQGLTGDAIVFGGNAGKLTRATSNTGTIAQMLDGQMLMYGVKETSTSGKFTDAFKNYVVWSSNTQSISNPDVPATAGDRDGWEYVGSTGTAYGTGNTAGTLAKNQTTKYWDYSSAKYHFVAGSPVKSFKYYTDADGDIDYATVEGLIGHINAKSGNATITDVEPIYVADPVIVPKTNYKHEVEFNFTRQMTFVRVGVFETIPGYRVSEIHFYEWDAAATPAAWKATPATTQNIILASHTAKYFNGTTTTTDATITYNWTTTPATYTSSYTSGLVESNNWYGGALDGVKAENSTAARADLYGNDLDMIAATGYFPVLPTKANVDAEAILVKCDYELTSEDGDGEIINVKGATAAIPAAFTKWNANTTYTYLFKIGPNTNGTTGTPGTTDPEGLFPITFDAVVATTTDGTAQGIVTTVSTPSITTYQEGSVTDAGVKYVKDKAINFTAQDDESGVLYTLSALTTTPAVSMVQVYKLDGAATEADLILNRPTTTVTTTIGASTWKTIETGKWASFTPDAAGYYAIEYVTATSPVAYCYKIVHVEE